MYIEEQEATHSTLHRATAELAKSFLSLVTSWANLKEY